MRRRGSSLDEQTKCLGDRALDATVGHPPHPLSSSPGRLSTPPPPWRCPPLAHRYPLRDSLHGHYGSSSREECRRRLCVAICVAHCGTALPVTVRATNMPQLQATSGARDLQ
ncbi:hypothetical protein LIA77_04663 [Sarocladium implicatum]|nr:hypothetical protein LIA77_04663 [Sarocladium implicatum]